MSAAMTWTREQQAAVDALKARAGAESEEERAAKYTMDAEVRGEDRWIWFWTTGIFGVGMGLWRWGDRLF